MLERAKEVTRCGQYNYLEYARFADDLVIVFEPAVRGEWLLKAVDTRFREELAALQVPINEAKSRIVDLAQGDTLHFLGFDFRRIRSRAGRWMPLYLPQQKKRTALLRTLKATFRRHCSRPLKGLIEEINPVLRGWVQYFAIGHSSRCFSFIRNWVEQKIRRYLAKARQRQGFGWKRWSRRWLYDTLGLFDEYRVTYQRAPKVAPRR